MLVNYFPITLDTLIQKTMIPKLREEDYYDAIFNGSKDIIGVLNTNGE